jgi:nucleoside-diphosphate-sugar epimerase
MKVLVTGGAGYIGSVASRILLEQGHQVRVLDSLQFDGRSLLGVYTSDNFEFIKGDVRSAEDRDRAVDGVDAVVHLAAIVGDPACARDPELTKQVNLSASLDLFAAARNARVERFIFASTCSNYGRMSDPTDYVNEESELSPVSLYAETKVAVESALLDTPKGGDISSTVLRFATVFGISPRMRFDLTVNEFTRDLLTNQKLTVFGEQFWRPYVHVSDVARAIVTVISAPIESVESEVFNVGNRDQNYTKGNLVELIRSNIPAATEIEHVHKDEDPRDYRVSFDKIQNQLGYSTTRTVEDGIREIIDAVEQNVFPDPFDDLYRN